MIAHCTLEDTSADAPRVVSRASVNIPRNASPGEAARAAKLALGIKPDARTRQSVLGGELKIAFPPQAALVAFVTFNG